MNEISLTFANPREGTETPLSYVHGNLTIDIKNCGVNLTPPEGCNVCKNPCRIGDIDGDGRFTSADATALARYKIGHDIEICFNAANFYGTGISSPADITSAQITLFARWLVGHKVQIDLRNNN